MTRLGTSRPPRPPETPAELRARAQRIRWHASTFAGDEAELRMIELAAELEAQATEADAAERGAG